MSKSFPVVMLLGVLLFPGVTGFGGSYTLTASTGQNVTLDGVLGPAEWSDGDSVAFPWLGNATTGVINGGGNIWVKNNGTNLLIAISLNARVTNSTPGNTYTYLLYLLFDNANNGILENLDDGKLVSIEFNSSGPVLGYADLYYDGANYLSDSSQHGAAAARHSSPGASGSFVWEFSIPLDSGDTQDFAWNLSPQRSLGLEVVFEELQVSSLSGTATRWAYWEVDYSSTGLPTGSSAQGWTNLVSQQAPIADNTPPVISNPIHSPTSPSPLDHVVISFNVTDTGSGVNNATVYYTTDDWVTANQTVVAVYNATSFIAEATMPLFNAQTVVKYYLVARDNAGNMAMNNNNSTYFSFTVGLLPQPLYLQSWFYALIAVLLACLAALVLYATRRRRPTDSKSS